MSNCLNCQSHTIEYGMEPTIGKIPFDYCRAKNKDITFELDKKICSKFAI